MDWLESIKAEFTVANLLLDYERPNDFVEPVCRVRSIWFVIYRVAFALYFWGAFLNAAFSTVTPNPYYLATFTLWSYVVLSVSVLVQTITAVHHFVVTARGGRDGYTRMPIMYRMQWVLTNMAMVSAPLLDVVYWIILYVGQPVTITNATVHGTNAIYVLLDRCVSASPVRLLHVWHSMLYGAVYSIFTAIHYAAGGATIYVPLDYHKAPGRAVAFLVCLTFLAAPFAHFLMYLLTVSRDTVWKFWKAHTRRHSRIAEMPSSERVLVEETSNSGDPSVSGVNNPGYQASNTIV